MSEIESWEKLEEPPQFLVQMKKIGIIYLLDDKKKNLTNGWILIHNLSNSLRLENLGNPNRVADELKNVQTFIEFYFAKEIQNDSDFRIISDKNYLDIYSEKKLQTLIHLQLTKPNAATCKYTIEEFMKFRGYWNNQNSDVLEDPFDLKFKYSSLGYQVIIKQDYHSWHTYGEIIPADTKILPWLLKIFKDLRIDYKELDACTYEIKSLDAFLSLTDLFRTKSHKN